ncbi:hypothetical protein [Comamonas sp. MYb396]|uniref:hypothetical protein n=1 Tax=Comamonas sp. MYb396 TaxID=2745302 RepID=UPI0030B60602
MATTIVSRSRTHTSRDAVWMSNGRLVSHGIGEPAIKKEIAAKREERSKDPQAMIREYIKRGILTAGGNVARRTGVR